MSRRYHGRTADQLVNIDWKLLYTVGVGLAADLSFCLRMPMDPYLMFLKAGIMNVSHHLPEKYEIRYNYRKMA